MRVARLVFLLFVCMCWAESVVRVCLPVSLTTRKTDWFELRETGLVRLFFTSLRNTIEPGFQYGVYLGYDAGDPLLDRPGAMEELLFLVRGSLQGAPIEVKGFRYEDTVNCNVRAVNYVTEECYLDGYDYFYRVNDDSVFQGGSWTSKLVKAMRALKVPDVGVVGPVDSRMTRLLTHSMVSRRHFEIYRYHFPWLFCNWWSDDWVTVVYEVDGFMRKLPDVSVTHIWFEKRYIVDFEIKKQYDLTVATTKKQWQDWLAANKDGYIRAPENDLKTEQEAASLVRACPWGCDNSRVRDRVISCLRRVHACLERKEPPNSTSPCSTSASYEVLWRASLSDLMAQYAKYNWTAVSIKELEKVLLEREQFRANSGMRAFVKGVDDPVRIALEDLAKTGSSLLPGEVVDLYERHWKARIVASGDAVVTAKPLPRNMNKVRCVLWNMVFPEGWFRYGDWVLPHCLAPQGTCGCEKNFDETYCIKEFFMGWEQWNLENFFRQCNFPIIKVESTSALAQPATTVPASGIASLPQLVFQNPSLLMKDVSQKSTARVWKLFPGVAMFLFIVGLVVIRPGTTTMIFRKLLRMN